MSIKIGQTLPSATLHEANPGDHVDPSTAFASGRTLLFAVPGAYTPGCSNTHLPGYLRDHDALKAKGIDQIVCVSVNDAFVMSAWGKANETAGKIRMLADPAAEFTKKLGLDVDASGPLGGTRSKRYAMVLDEGEITHLEVEPDGFGLSCSLAGALLERL